MEEIKLLAWLFDSLLGLGLLWLAWCALNSTDLFKAIVLFVTFGLLLALVWVRLEAPDIALAEAAIGAGLTGALLLAALARLAPIETDSPVVKQVDDQDKTQWLPPVAVALAAAGLGYAALSLPPDMQGLSADISTSLKASGVSNPVTAVLLNFRAYDTLLEMIVLLTALLGVWSLGEISSSPGQAPGPVLNTLTRLLVPILILVSAYLLWVGAHAPGGAFQAGSVLGAACVLLLLTGFHPHPRLMALPLRLLLVTGPVVFIFIALLSLMLRGQMLNYPPEQAAMLILVLETTATLSIAATLASLFIGGRPKTGVNE